jgi:hypothetical protein
VTHCYDLLAADPKKPWLPLAAEDATDEQLAGANDPRAGCQVRSLASAQDASAASAQSKRSNPCDPYLCLDPDVGQIDSQSGTVQAGAGDQPRTYAIAMLSVATKTATWPIVFEPRPSFTPERLPPVHPPPPPPGAPPAVQPSAPPPSASLPTIPPPPALPLGAGLSPTSPPAVPLPPSNSTPDLNLFTSPTSISVAPSLSLFPPAPPVINVAPPTPARPRQEAKKAAVQSSGSENDSPSDAGLGGDQANAPPTQANAATRRDRIAPGQSFTPLAHDQPSAWARDLQWGGGLTLMALVLAFGWSTVRPTPRRRQPELPAPAWVRSGQRRR